MRSPSFSSLGRWVPLLALAAALPACSLMTGGMSDALDLQTTGVAAPGTIVSIGDTGETINDDPVIRLEVEVKPTDGGAPFQTTIKRLLVSRVELPQFQPGNTIAVRYDPKDPSRASIDLGPRRAANTGNPYIDNFTPKQTVGGRTLPPPPVPTLYRGTTDDAADIRALIENNYLPLGTSEWSGGAAEPRLAILQAQQIGAGLVVLYGEVNDGQLQRLPLRPRGAGPDSQGTIGALPPQASDHHGATFWAQMPPAVFGVYSRPLNEQEKARLMRNEGMVVDDIANGSPAAAAGIQMGDVILAIDGKRILDIRAVPAFLNSMAGRQVRVDILRNGAPMSMQVKLNPLAPAGAPMHPAPPPGGGKTPH